MKDDQWESKLIFNFIYRHIEKQKIIEEKTATRTESVRFDVGVVSYSSKMRIDY